MKEIKAWQTTDGSVFVNEKQAEDHQRELNFREELLLFLQSCDLTDHQEEKLFDFIDENKFKLKIIFNKYF